MQPEDEFYEAIVEGDAQKVAAMIDGQPALLNSKAGKFQTPPLCACVVAVRKHGEGAHAVAELLLEAGADADATDFQGDTALHAAAEGGFPRLVNMLIAKGANVNAKGASPAILRAAGNGNVEIVGMLLDAGADIRTHDDNGDRPLHRAARRKAADAARTVEFLLRRGAEVDMSNRKGETELIHCLRTSGSRNEGENEVAVVRVLLEHGANVNERDNTLSTPLHYGVHFKPSEITKLLLEHGADPGIKNRKGETALDRVDHYEDAEKKTIISLLKKHQTRSTPTKSPSSVVEMSKGATTMTKEDAQRKYKEASAHFSQGQFEAAFALLEEIGLAFPGDPSIETAKQRCLAKLPSPFQGVVKARQAILQGVSLLDASDTREEVQEAFRKAAELLNGVPGNEFRMPIEALTAWGDPSGPFGVSNEIFDYCTRWITDNRERVKQMDAAIASMCRENIRRDRKSSDCPSTVTQSPGSPRTTPSPKIPALQEADGGIGGEQTWLSRLFNKKNR